MASAKPSKKIGKPAGKNDLTIIEALDMSQVVERDGKISLRNGMAKSVQCISSQELDYGVSIKAISGSKKQERNEGR